MNKFFKVAALCAAVVGFAACSSSDDEGVVNPGDGNGGGNNGPAPSPASAYVNRIVNEESGLTFVATHQFVEVCDESVVRFVVFKDGVDVTQSSSVYYIKEGKNVKLDAPEYNCAQAAGDYEFWVSHKTASTVETPLKVVALTKRPALKSDSQPASSNFLRRLLLVQGTGVTCQYCPNAIEALHNFYSTNAISGRVVLAAIHTFTTGDPLWSEGAQKIAVQSGISSYPTLKFNFDSEYVMAGATSSYFERFLNQSTVDLLALESETAVSVSTSYDEATGVISVNTGIKCDEPSKYKVTAMLVQDNVYFRQMGTENTDFYVHEAGVKSISPKSGTGFLLNCGDATERGKVYEYSCEFNASELVQESMSKYTLDVLRDARIIVYVQDGKIVDNVVSCGMNQSVGFDYQD